MLQVSLERTSFRNDLILFLPTCTNLDLSPEYEEVATGTKQKEFVNVVGVERFCSSALAMGWQTLALDNLDGRALLKQINVS